MSNYEILIEKLQENVDVIGEMVSDVNSYNGNLEEFYWCYNDEYFYETYFSSKEEVARAVYYGDYNFCDDYVKFNAYGNLETCTDYDRSYELRDNVEEIFDEWYDLYIHHDSFPELYNTEIMELIKKGGIKNEK